MMTRRTAGRLLAVVAVFASAFGCTAGTRLRGQLDAVREKFEQAEANGAYNCAPRELAMAKSHHEFALVELDEGYLSRAEAHFEIARRNADLAYELSPPDRCAPQGLQIVAPECIDRDGDGICQEADRCPDDPEDYDGYEDTDGCPEDQDTDGDTIKDSLDACVIDPEDDDGYEQQDGCPEVDNDLDGILDLNDRCINEPEDPDGFQDEDGCPDNDNDNDTFLDIDDPCPNEAGPADADPPGCPRVYVGAVVTTTHIEITQTIHFEYDKDVIRPESYDILNTVVMILTDYPNITLEIQGHTDSRGSDSHNLDLSIRRAASVRDYLQCAGRYSSCPSGTAIDASRLMSVGFGETCPIDDNRTDMGRARNRRVEFMRTDVEWVRPCDLPSQEVRRRGH
ncbi:MAG: OmpA family protein [Deltaproteobacteria bacterium]|nr:OmpA family protein [Deltaproteobacteria bacterium]